MESRLLFGWGDLFFSTFWEKDGEIGSITVFFFLIVG